MELHTWIPLSLKIRSLQGLNYNEQEIIHFDG